ncbi:TrbI/VirB10 family protein [Erwinia amylovora]|uniref:TrbI/VirB10 family protein n=1 Tax=Erwinia amylovora TaxID=552 RepID=UPI001443E32F|nr:TrbI/VirB10 family protein [Erwinia amylovora]
MEASKKEGGGVTQEAEALPEHITEGQGDFSLKPAGRKKGGAKLVIIIVVGFLGLASLLIGLLAYFVLRNPGGEAPVDETKVKAAPLLQNGRNADNAMTDTMGRLNEAAKAEKEKQAQASGSTPVTSPPATSPPQEKYTAGSTGMVNPTYASTSEAQAQPVQHPQESMFTTISRFDSSGMSGGSGGGGGLGASSSAGGGDQDAKLKAFINADPAELARNLVNATNSAGGGGSGGLAGAGGGSLLDSLNGTQYGATVAKVAPAGKYRLKKYTSFQCVLINGIKTDYPGFTKCSLTMPLYSADGSVILARAGAELHGEQKVEMKAGQSSVFTSWTELETSVAGSNQTVFTQLNGLGTDAMGRSGTDAEIDNHWGQKIGGALMLSTFQDAISNYSKRLGGGDNGSNNYSNTENTTEDMASKVLDANINIAPTGYVKPGTVINVIVAQDIEFSGVYTTRN